MNVLDRLITTQKSELISRINAYLAGQISHAAFSDYCWELIDFWKSMEIPEKDVTESNKYIIDCIYTGIRVADEEKFTTGISSIELEKYVDLLQREDEESLIK